MPPLNRPILQHGSPPVTIDLFDVVDVEADVDRPAIALSDIVCVDINATIAAAISRRNEYNTVALCHPVTKERLTS